MHWLWLLAVPLVPLVAALVLPVRLRLYTEPLKLEVRWGLLGFRLERSGQGLAKHVGLWAWWFRLQGKPEPSPRGLEKARPPKTEPKGKKAKRKKKKKGPKKKLNLGWAEVKMLLKHPVPRLLLLRLKRLGFGLVKAVNLSQARLAYGGLEPFGQGILAALAANWSRWGRFEWSSNFTGQTQLFVEARLLTWRFGIALLRFLFSLPYLKAYKLYRQLNQPQPANNP